MKKTAITKHCMICNSAYEVKAYRAADSKYCSRKCWSKRNPPSLLLAKPMDAMLFSRHTSGHKSIAIVPVAENISLVHWQPHWKGGVAKREREILAAPIRRWRIDVYKRDDYTCQRCGTRGGRLNAHHIKPWAKYPELRFDISNGETLCEDCHSLEHPGKDFANRRTKVCPDCGCKTTGRGQEGRCKSCGIKNSWDHGLLSSSRRQVQPASDMR